MSLPSLNPDKTAAGIIVDPKTLERVIPQSRRKDGTVRKEQKIRPGFTPQEDVGRFKTARQAASDLASSKLPVIPGSNRPLPAPSSSSNPDNPFAQAQALLNASKSKAQLKNEKRREKKNTADAKVGKEKNWDESDDEDEDGTGGLKEAFEADDLKRKEAQEVGNAHVEPEPAGSEMAVDGIGKEPVDGASEASHSNLNSNSGATDPATARMAGVSSDACNEKPESESAGSTGTKQAFGSGTTAILTAPPPGPDDQVVAPSLQPPSQNTAAASGTTELKSKADSPTWRKSPTTIAKTNTQSDGSSSQAPQSQAKPHPIQGGRKGPIGLANPPPHPTSSNTNANTSGNGGKAEGQTKGSAAPEPRVRKEVKVREGGANDLSSLASRVKNLVVANAGGATGTGEKKGGEGA